MPITFTLCLLQSLFWLSANHVEFSQDVFNEQVNHQVTLFAHVSAHGRTKI